MKNISENFTLGFSMQDNDIPVLTVARNTEKGLNIINIIVGVEAAHLYERLTLNGRECIVKIPEHEPITVGMVFGLPSPIPELQIPVGYYPWLYGYDPAKEVQPELKLKHPKTNEEEKNNE